MFILDTNVISELRKGKSGNADKNVIVWAESVPVTSLFISVITILEIEIGILQIERRDPLQAQILMTWLHASVIPGFSNRILAIDLAVAQRCARLHVPQPKADRDALIAATALVHGLTVITRNVSDFSQTGAELLNPWIGDN